MANNWAFATLAELKQRIGIAAADASDDALLTSLLDLTAGSIESAAGRPLRRCHARTEYFTGGAAVIQLDAYPIAKVHSVRESVTRNFDTVGAYQELVEGTDFVVDPGPGGQYGETGQLRRIGGRWLGSKTAPGCVRVLYAGGYKTDPETEAEKQTVILSSAGKIDGYSITLLNGVYGEDLATDPEIRAGTTVGAPTTTWRGVLRFDTEGVILPAWTVTRLVATWYHRYETGLHKYDVHLLSGVDPRLAGLSGIYAAIGANPRIAYGATAGNPTLTEANLTVSMNSDVLNALLTSLRSGFIALGFKEFSGTPLDAYNARIATVQHANPAYWPRLTVAHRPEFEDPYVIPDDLRNANLLQAVHEYMTRRTPGMISQATRGTIMPSGASYLKTAADLLPEVQRIALGYRRLF